MKKEDRQKAFLAAYAECGTILHAAKAAKITRETHYEWLRSDEAYKERFEEARKEAVEYLEREARRRAIEGTRSKKFTKSGDPIVDPETGKQYEELEYSDTLLIFLLKANAPEKYRERSDLNVSGTLGHAGQVIIQLPPTETDDTATSA
jgi:uncharacterized protein YycO